ncbi:MAG: type II secretion system ATPase GspE [Pseudomonadales bacterium]|nr:type II secretion system ATPase GspE [Pseudomonadales bacterium]
MDSVQDRSALRFGYSYAKRQGVVVGKVDHDAIEVLHLSGLKWPVFQELRRTLGRPLTLREVDQQTFTARVNEVYQNDNNESQAIAEGIGDEIDLASLAAMVPETEDLMDQEDDAPIIRLINALLTEAVRENASDIHIETYEKRLSVRLRVDGVLREVVQPRRELAPLLVSRIKVMARLDIAEKRVPQDGRISLRVAGREVDVRVSTMPSSVGERVVLRLLDKQAGRLNLGHLGMHKEDYYRLRNLVFKPHGIILVTGPTGSGKTTTLYAALTELNDKSRNLLTVEDPIEYQLDGVGQTQVNNKVEMTFARGLRAILRQDPDVVMVGEIRDLETAEIAIQASLTGHLVLSTLHTNSAVGAVTRLHDMGIEPFLLASSMIGVVAQRLVRTLCPSCKSAHVATAAEVALMACQGSAPTIFQPLGCSACNQAGYRGRTGIYEIIAFDDTLRNMVHAGQSEHDIEAEARRLGPGIREDGFRKVLSGETSLEEVLRITQEG